MTILRYPGGKTRAAKRIVAYIPEGTMRLYSPFFGGASVELEWLNLTNGTVYARDKFPQLANFWKHVFRGENDVMADICQSYLGLCKPDFYTLQDKLRAWEGSGLEMAAWFYVINRASFSGATLSGGMGDGSRFTQSACDRLRDFTFNGRIDFRSGDVFDSLRRRTERFGEDACIYLDPPYWIASTLYGDRGNAHTDFSHQRLRNLVGRLNDMGIKWIMSYNDGPEIRDLYHGFRMVPTTWKYGMSKDKVGRELLIFSTAIELSQEISNVA